MFLCHKISWAVPQRYPNMSHLSKFPTVSMSNMGNCCNGVFFNSSKVVKLLSEFNGIESVFLLKSYSYKFLFINEVRWYLFDIGPIVAHQPNFRSSSSNQSRTLFHALFADPRCVYQMTRGYKKGPLLQNVELAKAGGSGYSSSSPPAPVGAGWEAKHRPLAADKRCQHISWFGVAQKVLSLTIQGG